MDLTTEHVTAILVVLGWLLDFSGTRKAHVARDQLEEHLREKIRAESVNMANKKEYQKQEARGDLLPFVLHASDAEGKGKSKAGESTDKGYTEQKSLENLWLYFLAGYEMTANPSVYVLATLSLHPAIRANAIRDIGTTFEQAAAEGRQELTYREDLD
ncbi:MAG: hypothetical protein Q9210_004291 [Variospora velana]